MAISTDNNNSKIKVVIPDNVREDYNDALTRMKVGDNTLVGYEKQLRDLDAVLYNPTPIAMLLAREGSGKTALIEQMLYNKEQTKNPLVMLQLNLERLGELGSDVTVSRLRTLLTAVASVEEATKKTNPNQQFRMALFIDEIHKLNNYGVRSAGDRGSSGAMNALKEETSRGRFPLFTATTDYEYRVNIEPDPAFARRFKKIKIDPPTNAEMEKILQRRLWSYRQRFGFAPRITPTNLRELVNYSNAYIYDQANPAKGIMILEYCVGLCRRDHAEDPTKGLEITHQTIKDAFKSLQIDIDTQRPNEINLVIPPELQEKYNHSLAQLPMGFNTLIGYKDQLEQLDATMLNIDQPQGMLLGEAGSGKTALVEQWIYNRSMTSMKVAVISLEAEKLGALPENIMISRMRDLLTDLHQIEDATLEANPKLEFQMVLFIDEIHKLNNYGATQANEGSSAAMNALKEGLARGVFPVIGATTDYEYRQNIVADQALDRRFGKIIMQQPTLDMVIDILQRRLDAMHEKYPDDFIPTGSKKIFKEIVEYTDAFIRNQANPAKSLAILDKAVGIARQKHLKNFKDESGLKLTHEDLRDAFHSEGYTIDTTTTPEHVESVVKERVFGQPLALEQLANVVRSSLYVKRDFKRPLLTALLVGTTGTGKSQTAKQLAKAFFGREDAMVMINCGDYATKESAIDAQHFIGDHVQTNKEQLILLDEIEKADIAVMDTFMRMIDDGIVRDSHNIDRSINSTVVIATSNLGAQIFSQLSDTFHLDRQANPNKLDPALAKEWWTMDQTVRKALQNGDVGLNNGIKPEFLERFSLFIPFLPLAKKTIAMIAHWQIQDFVKSMREDSIHSINIQIPAKESHERWAQLMHTDSTPYGDDDPISVMIAEDVIGKDSQVNGARAINRYINSNLKLAVINLLDSRIKQRSPIDGIFKLEARNSSFQTSGRKQPEVICTYVPKDQL